MRQLYVLAAVVLLGAADPLPVEVHDNHFRMPVPLPRRLVAQAETHIKVDQALIFIPGAARLVGDRRISEGPVSRVRAQTNAKGVVITLWPRSRFDSASQLRLRTDPQPAIVVEGAAPAAPAQPAAQAAAAPSDTAVEKTPPAASGEELPFGRDFGWQQGKAAAGKAGAAAERGTSVAVAVAAAALCALGMAYLLKKRRVLGQPGNNTIAVLAARALGGRHKLAVVQVDGERLLLAMSEHEVSLISHLAPAHSTAGEGASAVAPRFVVPDRPPVTPREAPVPEPGLPAADAPGLGGSHDHAAATQLSAMSSDVQGLLSLRQPQRRGAEATR